VIITGATYGRIIGMIMRSLSSDLSQLDEGLYAILGSASFLGGSMRMTVSICVILLELTNNLLMLPLTMLVLLISKTIGDMFNHSVYDQILHIKELPYLEEHPEPYMKHLVAYDVCSRPLLTFSTIEMVMNIVDVMQRTSHNAFPVIGTDSASKKPILYGLILRSHLLVLLKSKAFFPSSNIDNEYDARKNFRSSDFGKPGSGKSVTIDDIEISQHELEMYIDLHPYTNTSPYTVVDTMSLAKAFTLFRRLGLRHLCVIPKVQTVSSFKLFCTRLL
jgi:chloride channel 7